MLHVVHLLLRWLLHSHAHAHSHSHHIRLLLLAEHVVVVVHCLLLMHWHATWWSSELLLLLIHLLHGLLLLLESNATHATHATHATGHATHATGHAAEICIALTLTLHRAKSGSGRDVHLRAILLNLWADPHRVQGVSLPRVEQTSLVVDLGLALLDLRFLLVNLCLILLHRVEVEKAGAEAFAFLNPCGLGLHG